MSISLNYRFTLNLLQRINFDRIQKGEPILYPDDQILTLFDQQIPLIEIPKYSSCLNVQFSTVSSSNILQNFIAPNTTHLACRKETNGDAVVFQSERVIAVDKVVFKSHKCFDLSITVQSLSNEERLWGVKAVPAQITNQKEKFKLINPNSIIYKNDKYFVEIPEMEGSKYQRLVFYGTQKLPRYGRKIHGNELPEGVFTLYQMAVRIYPSYQQTFQSKNQETLYSSEPKQPLQPFILTPKFPPHSKQAKENPAALSKEKVNEGPSLNKQLPQRRQINQKQSPSQIKSKSIPISHKQNQLNEFKNMHKAKNLHLQQTNAMTFLEKIKYQAKLEQFKKACLLQFNDKRQNLTQLGQQTAVVRNISNNSQAKLKLQQLTLFNPDIRNLCIYQKESLSIIVDNFSLTAAEKLTEIISSELNPQPKVAEISVIQCWQLLQFCQQLDLKIISQLVILFKLMQKSNIEPVCEIWTKLRLWNSEGANSRISSRIKNLFNYYLLYLLMEHTRLITNKISRTYFDLEILSDSELLLIAQQMVRNRVQCAEKSPKDLADHLNLLQRVTGQKNIIGLFSKFTNQSLSLSFCQDQIAETKETSFITLVFSPISHLQILTKSHEQKNYQESEIDFTMPEYNQFYSLYCSCPYKCQSKEIQIIQSQQLKYNNSCFRLFLSYDPNDPKFVTISVKRLSTENDYKQAKYLACHFKVEFKTKKAFNSSFQTANKSEFYFVWSDNSKNDYFPSQKIQIFDQGCDQQELSRTELMMFVYIRQTFIDSACLQYLSMRATQLINVACQTIPQKVPKVEKSLHTIKRLSCIQLEGELLTRTTEQMSAACLSHKSCSLCAENHSLLYELNEMQLFALLSSDHIGIQEQWTLLLFLIKYYFKKELSSKEVRVKREDIKNPTLRRLSEKFGLLLFQNQEQQDSFERKDNNIPHRALFLALRYDFISFKKLLTVYNQQEFLRQDPIFLEILKEQMEKRFLTPISLGSARLSIPILINTKPRVCTQKIPSENYLEQYQKLHKMSRK